MHKVDGFKPIDIVYVITIALNPMKIWVILPRSVFAHFFLNMQRWDVIYWDGPKRNYKHYGIRDTEITYQGTSDTTIS